MSINYLFYKNYNKNNYFIIIADKDNNKVIESNNLNDICYYEKNNDYFTVFLNYFNPLKVKAYYSTLLNYD